VDAAREKGMTLRELGRVFGPSLGTLHRHLRHAPPAPAIETKPEQDGEGVLAPVDALASKAEQLLGKAVRSGDFRGALAVLQELRESPSKAKPQEDVTPEIEQRRREERARSLEQRPDKGHRWGGRCRCIYCGVPVEQFRHQKWSCAAAIAGTDLGPSTAGMV
jgi:hypothetical protein